MSERIEVETSVGKFVQEGNTVMFSDYALDKCRKSPNGEHDWSGPVVELGNESGVTCAHCGLYFGDYALRCLP